MTEEQRGEDPPNDWEQRLNEGLARVFDTFFASTHAPAETVAASPLDVPFVGLPPDQVPWRDASDEERESFREATGRTYDETLRRAFGATPTRDVDAPPHALAVTDDVAARAALLRLFGWDVRHLFSPTAYWALRSAQLASDDAFLDDVAQAIKENRRYGGRHSRKQRRLNRVLIQLGFGARRAFSDNAYRNDVRIALRDAYRAAEAPIEGPSADPAWAILDEPKLFRKHLDRLGLLGSDGTTATSS